MRGRRRGCEGGIGGEEAFADGEGQVEEGFVDRGFLYRGNVRGRTEGVSFCICFGRTPNSPRSYKTPERKKQTHRR